MVVVVVVVAVARECGEEELEEDLMKRFMKVLNLRDLAGEVVSVEQGSGELRK